MRSLWRLLTGLIVTLAALIALLVALVPINIRRSFPQTEGEIRLSGLGGPVDIYRDSFGVPHIFASSEHDLFFAQGYVHAQDRFWQMEFWRHQGAGRLSELLGGATRNEDIFLKTLGWERVAREELASLDPGTRGALEAYAQGVNAYLADHRGTALSMEYFFLPVLNRGYEPAPWEPLHTLTWAKAMAWMLSGNLDTELEQARLLKTLSPEQLDQLYPPYPDDRPVIVRQLNLTATISQESAFDLAPVRAAAPALESLRTRINALNGPGMRAAEAIGSNSWAVSGPLSATGMPMLANDPHLAVQMPPSGTKWGCTAPRKAPPVPWRWWASPSLASPAW